MILCAGEALIDMLPRRTGAGEMAFAPYAGGAVFNTAIALGRLGAPAGFLCGLSADLFGEKLVEVLTASDVDTALCPRVDRPTTLAFVTLSPSGHASYAFYDEATALSALAPEELPAPPPEVSAVFVGGISLAGSAAHAFEDFAGRARDRVLMIDPNVRPAFARDEAAYRSRIARLVAMADIVKISDEDLVWLEGDGGEDAARALLDRGPRLVCLTRGADGATALTRGLRVEVPAVRTEVVDTVGAGDTFNAGLLAGLSEAGALEKGALADLSEPALRAALELGARAASVTVSRAGANPPWRSEL